MPRLNQQERGIAIGMLQAGSTATAVARHFRCHVTTITRLLARHQQTGNVRDRPRSGRPKVTTPAQDRHIRVTHLRNRQERATQTAATIQGPRRHISADTVRRRLRAAGIRCRRPYVGPILTQRHRQQRLQWARQHQRWRRQQWQQVLFSDESRFNMSHADGRVRVWRRRNERYANCCVVEADRWGGGSLMVWGGFSYHHRTRLHVFRQRVTAVVYRDQVLHQHVLPLFQAQRQLQIFQQDNARPHTARVSMDFLRANNIAVLPWPSLSPDMAPIEHVWDEIGRRIHTAGPTQNLRDLEARLIREWNQLPQAFFQRLVDSMRRRCTACIDANGGHTRY